MTTTSTVTMRETLTLSREDMLSAWLVYNEAFAELETLSATRHLFNWPEFEWCAKDHRILKYMPTNADRRVVGIGALTNYLDAWPTISAPFFKRHWPQLYEEHRIWYVGFVAAAKRSGVFPDFLRAMTNGRKNDLFIMDFCAYNELERHMPEVSKAVLLRNNPHVQMHRFDQQSWWAVAFHA
jgi:hypothetical protein